MQAVHWFDLDVFYKEVKRVLVPHGVLALGSYLIPRPVSKDQKRMDSIIQNVHYVNYTKTWSAYQLYLKQQPSEAEKLSHKLTTM
ncbi:hypothetical protein HPB50_010812 [Hyalomma asiaticum]|uniref:Uncharacterized protein n=1 Tax=Hyalomma asiaticum TaxID=266040 RepID=A0ACB7SPK6_HYAAI|nr:hypothetical protein HPB50_010812 [Hyalomma asiaticum]